MRSDPLEWWPRRRRQLGALVVDSFFEWSSSAFRRLPPAEPGFHGVELTRDVPYGDHPRQVLDVYRPAARPGPLPIVVYIHGGGFRFLAKDTHWVFGLGYARAGYLVFNVEYRLAPEHPYPAAVEDVCRAWAWLAANAATYGGDLSRVVIAGESAGANLATALTLATTFERPEPFARAAYETGLVPRATMPACGILQVSDPERYQRRKKGLSPWAQDRISEVADAYLRGVQCRDIGGLDLADPLLLLERLHHAPSRPLPPFFTFVGTADPLLDDTRRLKVALERRGVPCDVRYYRGEPHAFHAFVMLPNAREAWRETYSFLGKVLSPAAP